MRTKLSLYIHIPFCIQKCRYCDFLSGPADDETRKLYVKRLIQDIHLAGRKYEECKYEVITIYIGGGTPSVLPGEDIADILDVARESFPVAGDAEITVEINPGTVDSKKLQIYRQAGVNRLSIGLQSANDSELAVLGRIHQRKDFEACFSWARELGFTNISVDLMSALPGQSVRDYRNSLEYVISLHPEHISSYSFQLEEGTWFWNHRNEYSWPSEELDRELYDLTGELLELAGYNRYEISNYSLPGFESRHNSVYWTRGEYLGLGLGASSLIGNTRFRCTEDLDLFLKPRASTQGEETCCEVIDLEELSVEARMEEFMFLGLRLMKGVSPESFREIFGEDIRDIYGEVIDRLCNQKLLEFDGRYKLTKQGIDISNFCLAQFLMD